jgi:hypothetical protein
MRMPKEAGPREYNKIMWVIPIFIIFRLPVPKRAYYAF